MLTVKGRTVARKAAINDMAPPKKQTYDLMDQDGPTPMMYASPYQPPPVKEIPRAPVEPLLPPPPPPATIAAEDHDRHERTDSELTPDVHPEADDTDDRVDPCLGVVVQGLGSASKTDALEDFHELEDSRPELEALSQAMRQGRLLTKSRLG